MDVVKKERFVGIIHHLEVGGAERMMVNILNYFHTEGLEVHLVIFNYKGELRNELNKEILVDDLGIASVAKGMIKCLKTIHSLKPNYILSGIGHLNIALAPFVPLMKRLMPQSRWISRETNIVSLQNQVANAPKLFDWLYKHTYSNYDLVIAQSKDMRDDLVEKYSFKGEIVVINNPIDIARANELAEVKSSFSFNKEKINLLSLSALRQEKRHDLMIESLTLLPKEYHLTIVGSGEKEEVLKELVLKLDLQERVTFEGHQSNPYPYMKRADLFLLTSEREGFPNVLLEANALGLPIVAFACQGGIKEIVQQKVNGLHVPFGDVKGFALAIEEAMQMEFDKKAIEEMIKRKYSHEVILQNYKEVLL